MAQAPPNLTPEIQQLLDRWVESIEGKNIDALASVFHRGPELAVFWSNGERNVGWEEVRRHIEADFRKEVDLAMNIRDCHATPLGEEAAVLTYRYEITLSAGDDSFTVDRLASMAVHRSELGWRVAALHVSTVPPTATPPA